MICVCASLPCPSLDTALTSPSADATRSEVPEERGWAGRLADRLPAFNMNMVMKANEICFLVFIARLDGVSLL